MRRRLRFVFALASLAVPAAFACGEDVVDIPPPEDGADASAEDGGGGTPGAGDGGSGGDADARADVVCPTVTPDDAAGVFVAKSGTASPSCGTRLEPCGTIALGIARAGGKKKNVYVARGVYVEHVVLEAGVRLEGGYDVMATGAWNRTCVDPADAVVVRAPGGSSSTVAAEDLGGKAEIAFMRIESKAQNAVAAGESLYGVVARGATTSLELEEIHIEMANAGAGKAGDPGDAGAAGSALGCPPPSTGQGGAAGERGAGAPAGTFTSAGWSASAGTGGQPGAAGTSGTAGAAGTCVTCGTCTAACIFLTAGTTACGTDGLPGCPGGAGEQGGGGGSGGSSIGLFSWDATVVVKGGRIRAGDAGSGGSGGAGGAGGKPALGAAGKPTDDCVVGCQLDGLTCNEVKGHGEGGARGGDGGAGGAGGPGGGGAGGSSFAIYQGGTGVVTTQDGTSLAFGKAGKGGGPAGGAGSSGAAAARVP